MFRFRYAVAGADRLRACPGIQPRSGADNLSHGRSPWFAVSERIQSRRDDTIVSSLRDWTLGPNSSHGLKPVARIVAPLRG